MSAAWLVALLLAAEQLGEAEQQQAKLLHQKAMGHYSLGEYQQALDAFTAAFELAPASGLLFNIAQSHRMLGKGHCAKARLYYSRYLAAMPNASNRGLAEEQYRNLETCAREEELKAPAKEEPDPPRIAPPAPGESPAAPAMTPELTESTPPRRAPAVLVGLGGVLGLGGATMAIASAVKFSDLVGGACSTQACAPSVWQPWDAVERAGWVLVGLGGALLVAGILWLVAG